MSRRELAHPQEEGRYGRMLSSAATQHQQAQMLIDAVVC